MTQLKLFVTHHEDKKLQAKVNELAKHRPELFLPKQVESSKFFESAAFADAIIDDPTVDFVGHLTHSYKSKIAPFDFDDLVKKYEATADVIGLFPGTPVDMYEFAERVHPGFTPIWMRLLELLGYPADVVKSLGTPTAFYSNYWIARRALWNEYCAFATRAMQLLDTDPILKELCQKDSNYRGTIEGTVLSPTRLQQICGAPYYTFHPFVMERLAPFFFHTKNARIQLISAPTTESWNTYTTFQGASFVIDNKRKRVL